MAQVVARPDGSGIREVSPRCRRPPVGDRIGPGCSENFYPALSPDGRRVAFSHAFGASETSRSTTLASTRRV